MRRRGIAGYFEAIAARRRPSRSHLTTALQDTRTSRCARHDDSNLARRLALLVLRYSRRTVRRHVATARRAARTGRLEEPVRRQDRSTAGRKPQFGGEGDVEVKDGQIVMHAGNPMTGITCTQEVPKIDYEISLEAMRVDGSDFFCGLTFPVGESPCSFIVGGWGGGVVGLSSIDGSDASENETTKYQEFESGRWYTVRVRVTKDKIEAWLDKKQMVDLRHQGPPHFDPHRSRAVAPVGHLLLRHDRGAARHQGPPARRRTRRK